MGPSSWTPSFSLKTTQCHYSSLNRSYRVCKYFGFESGQVWMDSKFRITGPDGKPVKPSTSDLEMNLFAYNVTKGLGESELMLATHTEEVVLKVFRIPFMRCGLCLHLHRFRQAKSDPERDKFEI